MLLTEYIDKLPDAQYQRCAVTANVATLAIDAPDLSSELKSSLLDVTLTSEKAVCVAAIHLKAAKPVTDPLAKLSKYYQVKTV